MKILMLTPYLPYPPSSGGQVRSYNLLKNLGKKHKVVLVALIKNDQEKKFIKKLEKFCEKIYVCKRSESAWTLENVVKSVFGPYPFLVVRNFSHPAKDLVFNLIKKNNFDLIHAETFYVMPHLPKTDIPIILVEQTIEYQVYQHFVNTLSFFFLKPFFYFDILKLKFWEKNYWKKANIVVAVSQKDKQKMLALLPSLKIKIIPNGAGEDLIEIFKKKKIVKKSIFLYLGNFAWLQNVEAANILAKKIFPEIKKKITNAVCYIAGQKAHEKIHHLQKYGIKIIDIKHFDINKVKEIYSDASIFLAPIQGPGGTRLKILGAMAAGLPIISSKVGVEGLKVKHGENVLVAQNENEFVNNAIKLLHDRTLYQKIRVNARRLIEQRYSWNIIAQDLDKIYSGLKKTYYENSH